MEAKGSRSHLPRLADEFYRGRAVVHWTMCIRDRQTGWLTREFHLRCREALLHAMVHYQALSPAYCLMPDHAHFVWMGLSETTDLARAAEFFRRQTGSHLKPFEWQKEPFDHVLREEERRHGAFAAVCHYVMENPVRKELVTDWRRYEFSGTVLPGYPDLDPRREDFWDVFWKIYNAKVERGQKTAP